MYIKPSRGFSVVGAVAGVIFTLIGIEKVIPSKGLFGVLWTLIAVVITCYFAYNAFSKRGISPYQVDFDVSDSDEGEKESFDVKLRKLKRLKDDGLISEEEYEVKRKEILSNKW
ncbi:hypothetical protein CEB3_c02480 [Peptococcaceae bacterium CEB3]|nr:hypothetical protein CEB3_c02480 [Peptococcaceae bacterium CEB3]